MVLPQDKSTFTFFKMIGCGGCEMFAPLFNQLTKDPEVKAVVNLDEVEFGVDAQGNRFDLSAEYPDLKDKIKYAPFLWLSPPYDETTGYHLDPNTMFNSRFNPRVAGKQFIFQSNTTYASLKQWILDNAAPVQRGKCIGFGKKCR